MRDEEKNLTGDCALDFIRVSFELKSSKLYKEAIEMLYKALSCSDVGDGKCEIISQIAFLYFSLKNYERAIEQFEKALDINPENPSALYGLADVYFELKDYNKALEYASLLVKYSPDEKNFLFYFKILFELKKYSEIMEVWGEISSQYQEDSDILYIISKTDIQNKKQILEKIVSSEPNNFDSRFDLAKLFYAEKDYRRAIELFLEANSIKNTGDNYYYLGLSYFAIAEFDLAINSFLSAVKYNPKNPDYYLSLSKAYIENFWFEEALISCKKSIELNNNPDELPQKQILLSWLNFKLNKIEQALLNLSSIDENNEFYNDAQILKCVILYEKGDIVKSKMKLEDIIKEDPKDPILYSTLGKIYKDMQYQKSAIEIYEKGLLVEPRSVEFRAELVDLYIDINELEKAEYILGELFAINPKILPIYNSRARIFYKKKEFERAKEELLTYLSYDKNNSEVHYFLGLVLNELNEADLAIEYIKNAIEINPNCGKYYSQFSRSYEIKGDNALAMSFAKEACIVEPREPLFYQRALDLAKRLNLTDDIDNFERKVKYFRV